MFLIISVVLASPPTLPPTILIEYKSCEFASGALFTFPFPFPPPVVVVVAVANIEDDDNDDDDDDDEEDGDPAPAGGVVETVAVRGVDTDDDDGDESALAWRDWSRDFLRSSNELEFCPEFEADSPGTCRSAVPGDPFPE